jgi:hypothetical protein
MRGGLVLIALLLRVQSQTDFGLGRLENFKNFKKKKLRDFMCA